MLQLHAMQTVIAGNSAVNLGQQSNTWRPLVKTTANLTDVRRYFNTRNTPIKAATLVQRANRSSRKRAAVFYKICCVYSWKQMSVFDSD